MCYLEVSNLLVLKIFIELFVCLKIAGNVSEEPQVADHCSVYATSDPSDKSLRKRCKHKHDKSYEHCKALDNIIKDIEGLVREASFPSSDDLDEAFYVQGIYSPGSVSS